MELNLVSNGLQLTAWKSVLLQEQLKQIPRILCNRKCYNTPPLAPCHQLQMIYVREKECCNLTESFNNFNTQHYIFIASSHIYFNYCNSQHPVGICVLLLSLYTNSFLTRETMDVYRNIDVGSRNRCCCGRAVLHSSVFVIEWVRARVCVRACAWVWVHGRWLVLARMQCSLA